MTTRLFAILTFLACATANSGCDDAESNQTTTDAVAGQDSNADATDTAVPMCPAMCETGSACDETSGTCVDIDECAATDACASGEACTNLAPGFLCETVMPPLTGCGLTEAAFCEDFEGPIQPGGRGGDLDEAAWGVARWSHDFGNAFYRTPATSTNDSGEPDNPDNGEATFCGAAFDNVGIGDDMRICPGNSPEGGMSNQLHEVGHDTGDFLLNSMMIRQPFDFADRTGTFVFDVDAKHNRDDGGHGWWIEVFVSEEPVPAVYQEAPSLDTQPRNGIGFEFVSNGTACNETGHNILSNVIVLREFEIHNHYTSGDHYERVCFEATDLQPNRFEIRLSRDTTQVWVSDSSTPTETRMIADLTGIDLGFDRGYITLHHVGYNGIKDAALPSQTYRWDNIGFDGPRLSPLRAYDIPNNAGQDFGYEIAAGTSQEFQIENVVVGDAQQAWFNLNYLNYSLENDATVEFRINGNAWHFIDDYIVGHNPERSTATVRAFSEPLLLSELQEGTNTIEIRGGADLVEVANMDLSLR